MPSLVYIYYIKWASVSFCPSRLRLRLTVLIFPIFFQYTGQYHFTIFTVLNSIKYVFYITVNISVADSLQKIIVDMNKISIYWSFRLPGISYKKNLSHWPLAGAHT